MNRFEYKVVPAPQRGAKARGARTPEERFAHALSTLMNDLGSEGWEYVRADSLPCEERTGLTGKSVVYRNMLVFRRALASAPATSAGVTPEREAPAPEPTSIAARLAATLRPARPDGEAVRRLGPADRGTPGQAPRLVTDAGQERHEAEETPDDQEEAAEQQDFAGTRST